MNKKNKHGAILIGILGIALIVLMFVYSGNSSSDVKVEVKPAQQVSEVNAATDAELEAQNKELEKRISEIHKQLDSYAESEGSHGGN